MNDKMTETDLDHEVESFLLGRIEAGETIPADWIATAVIEQHPNIDGEDTEWYRSHVYGAVRNSVRRVLRKFKPTEDEGRDEQMILPGFERLQRAYLVEREAAQRVVPINQLTDEEIAAKVVEYETMAAGCLKHADELRRYLQERSSRAA